jgi:hypothetical protein
MPAGQRSGNPPRKSRQELEAQLLAELKHAESEFQSAAPDQKDAAGERYRRVLERFNTLILGHKIPPDTAGGS